MDLSTLQIDPENQTAEMEVVHPKTFAPITDDKGKKVTILLHGPDSSAQKKVLRKHQNKHLNDAIKKRNRNLSAEQLEARALDLDVAATVGWNNLAFEGEQLKCNPKNVRKVYLALPWLKEQVEEFISERSNFLDN